MASSRIGRLAIHGTLGSNPKSTVSTSGWVYLRIVGQSWNYKHAPNSVSFFCGEWPDIHTSQWMKKQCEYGNGTVQLPSHKKCNMTAWVGVPPPLLSHVVRMRWFLSITTSTTLNGQTSKTTLLNVFVYLLPLPPILFLQVQCVPGRWVFTVSFSFSLFETISLQILHRGNFHLSPSINAKKYARNINEKNVWSRFLISDSHDESDSSSSPLDTLVVTVLQFIKATTMSLYLLFSHCLA